MAPGALVIRGGTVVDATGERRADVWVSGGRVVDVAREIDERPGGGERSDGRPGRGTTVLDAVGCFVFPGLVDLHAHLRQPGDEEAETVLSASRAAALGGFTAVVAMPNTDPPLDSAEAVSRVRELANGALCEIAVAGAITVDRGGERLAPMAEMAGLGVRLFTDDGAGVQDAGVMRRALDYARDLGVVLAQHCEDVGLARGGHMHEGEWSSRLGIAGIPAEAEEVMLARDLALVRLTGSPMHFLHLSTARSVGLVREAKREGLPVTAEVSPHHLTLTDAELASFDPVFKVNPPLRPAEDVAALRAALMDGTVDAVATDHAPHAAHRKDVPVDQAASGVIGLETALAVMMTELVAHGGPDRRADRGSDRRADRGSDRGSDSAERSRQVGTGAPRTAASCQSLARLVMSLSWSPAAIAGLAPAHGGPLVPGAAANLCVFDPAAEWVVEPTQLASRSRNTAFAGKRLTGRVRHTVCGGEAVVVDGKACR